MGIGLGLKGIQIDTFIPKIRIKDTVQGGKGRGGGHPVVYRQLGVGLALKVAFNIQY